jgi:hypothetical protein
MQEERRSAGLVAGDQNAEEGRGHNFGIRNA